MAERQSPPNRILIDQDGVLADFEKGFLDKWRELYPDRPFVPLAQRKTFNIADDYPAKYWKDILAIFTSENYILNLDPIEGAIQAIGEMEKAGLTVKICTSPFTAYRYCVTEKYGWLEKHLGHNWVKRMILTKDKTDIRGDILIDDKPVITGNLEPTWEHVLFDQPYNKEVVGKRRLVSWHNWQAVLLK